MKKMLGIVLLAGMLAAPAPAFALRYASPTGNPANDCQTIATACDLEVAIEGTGGNMPVSGEEVIVLPGPYSLTTDVLYGAANLNVHGAFDQPRPVITLTGLGRFSVSNTGIFSYLRIDAGASEAVNLSGGAIAERLFMTGTPGGGNPVCQCYTGLLRNSVVITGGPGPAVGVASNGASATMTYRNVTAYSTNAAAAAFQVQQIGGSGTLTFTAFNTIALNAAGGNDVVADGPNPGPGSTTITFTRGNYRTTAVAESGVIEDAVGDMHQTALPIFTNVIADDFSQASNSPTINMGITDAQNGDVDFAGNPRTVEGITDIGAFEFVPANLAPPSPGAGAPAARKCKKGRKLVKRKGKRRCVKKKRKRKR